MTTNNAVGNGLTGATGSVNFVGSTSPTITTPVIGTIVGTNGFNVVALADTAATTDYFTITSNTNNNASIAITSSQTNASFELVAKGSGGVAINPGVSANTPLSIYFGANNIGFNASAITGNRSVTFPDGNVVLVAGTMAPTVSPSFTTPTLGAATATSLAFSPTTGGIIGTATNDSAATGYVGEYISSFNSSPVSLSTGSAAQVATISLTAGDWDVFYQIVFTPANTTLIGLAYAGVNTTTATISFSDFGATSWLGTFTGDGSSGLSLTGSKRVSISGTTSIYANALLSFATSTATATGGLWARRVR